MGDLKPLGSEKLSGDDKLKRILELTYYNNNKNTSATQKAEHISYTLATHQQHISNTLATH